MNKKQVIGAVIAAVVFALTGIAGVASSYFLNSAFGSLNDNIYDRFFSTLSEDVSLPLESFVGIVKINGTISDAGSSTAFNVVEYDHRGTLSLIDSCMNSEWNQGLLLEIDSPGGAVYETDEVYLKLMEYKEKTGRPVWAYFGSMACSGGYYIGAAADEIKANRNGWTGSIGVIVSLTNYKELFDKVGIQEINITSGKNKAMGSGGEELTDEQRAILQSLVDEAYEQFVSIVAKGRNMPVSQVKTLADGRIYSAQQAEKAGLIDGICTLEEYKTEIMNELGEDVEFYEYNGTSSFFSMWMSAFSKEESKSDLQVVQEMMEHDESGVLMYYAAGM